MSLYTPPLFTMLPVYEADGRFAGNVIIPYEPQPGHVHIAATSQATTDYMTKAMRIRRDLMEGPIDWTKPLELLDGTPVRLETGWTQPDHDGDWWIEREDGQDIVSVERTRRDEPITYRQLCVHPQGWEEGTETIIVRNRR